MAVLQNLAIALLLLRFCASTTASALFYLHPSMGSLALTEIHAL